MRVREAARRLDVCPSTIYALVASGRLRCLRVGNGRGCIRILDEHLEEYVRSAETRRPVTPPPVTGQVRAFRHVRIPGS